MQRYEFNFGEISRDASGKYVLYEDAVQIEEQRDVLRNKLSEMIIVNGVALACSPDVKSAYEKSQARIDAFMEFFKAMEFKELDRLANETPEAFRELGETMKSKILTLLLKLQIAER